MTRKRTRKPKSAPQNTEKTPQTDVSTTDSDEVKASDSSIDEASAISTDSIDVEKGATKAEQDTQTEAVSDNSGQDKTDIQDDASQTHEETDEAKETDVADKDVTDKNQNDKQTTENMPAEVAVTEPTEPPPADTAPEPQQPTQPAPAAAEKQPSNWTGKAALALSIVALGASGYIYWLSLQQTQANTQQASAITSEVNNTLKATQGEVDRTVADLSRQLDSVRTQVNADKVSTEELQLRLTRSMQQLTAKEATNRKDWLLAEVEYLLRLANQRVLMEQTADGALSLLKSADTILSETDDVTIYEVRKDLAEDIAALEAVPRVDTEGVFLKLSAINKQVDQLRMVPVAEQRELPDLIKEITPETVEESWSAPLQENWNKAIDKFNSLIVIQHRDEKVEALLSPQENFYLQQNLHLMLEQAQLALLQRKQTAYDTALAKAEDWTTKFFNPKEATTQAVIRGIADLKSINVSPSMPNISGSLATLKDYVKTMATLKQEGES